MRSFAAVCLLLPALLTCPPTARAQSLSTDKAGYVIGEAVTLRYRTPVDDDFPAPSVGLFSAETGSAIRTKGGLQRGAGEVILKAPDRPGRFEARLFHGDRVFSRRVLTSLATPVPGALSLEKGVFIAGEAVTLVFELPENRYLEHHAYVTMTTSVSAENGEAAAGRHRGFKSLEGKRSGTLAFSAPDRTGHYVFRLYDRRSDWGPYLLDKISYEVVLPPEPGALSLEKEVFIVDETVTLGFEVPEGRYLEYHAYVTMTTSVSAASEEAAAAGERHHDKKSLEGKRTGNLAFRAPNLPGRYVFRLYDRRIDWGPYLLDKISYEVVLPPEPGALSLPEGSCVEIGQPIRVTIEVPDGRYLEHHAFVELINPVRTATRSVAAAGGRRIHAASLEGLVGPR